MTGSNSFVNLTTPGSYSNDFYVCPTEAPMSTEYPPYTHYPPYPPYPTGDSIFGASESIIHFSYFSRLTSFFALFVSLYVLVGHS